MIIEIDESKLLCHIRRSALWAFLVSAFVFLVLQLLELWNAIELIDTSFRRYGEPNGWGRIQNSFAVIMYISLFVLLAVLVAKYAKKDDGGAAKKPAKAKPKAPAKKK